MSFFADRFVGLFMALLLLSFLTGCSNMGSESDLLSRAEEATRKEDFDSAITFYQRHIDYRLAAKERPEWENPYFYLLLIGDLHLRANDPGAALESYQEAELREVETELVSDRYRTIASWYEQKGDLAQAMNILQEFRDRDDLLFDAMLDRVARKITEQELAAGPPVGSAALPAPSPSPTSSAN